MPGFEFLDDADFVTTVEAASLLGVTKATVAYWVNSGRLSADDGHGRVNLIRVRVGSVRRLMAQQAVNANG